MESALEGYFGSLKGKKVAVIGLGVSNQPLVEGLLDAGVPVLVCDKRRREDFNGLIEGLERRGMTAALGHDYLDHLDGADVIFRTPGLRPDVPQIARAVAAGAELTSEMEAFLDLCPCRVIAVTGSDGKTTTTTIIAGLLKAAGYRTFVGGNIGHPLLCQVDDIRPDDMVVLELSSFQLMTVRQSPSIAVVTNLAPNHLDVHKDMDEYVSAKRNIFAYQDAGDRLVLNADNEITAGFAREARGTAVLFSRRRPIEGGVWLKDKTVMCGGRPVLAASDILLPGLHNLENYMAAVAAVDGLVPDEVIREYARAFGGVAHRIELVRELDGARWYNDSIASSPSRTIAGLRSFDQKVILIAGGYDKHIPYDVLGPEIVERVKALFLTGDTAEKIKAATLAAPGYREGEPAVYDCADLRDAVERSRALAKPGDVVILSPASASFDRFKNFEERGNVFKELVNGLHE
ncbi:MAG: UDP-N-acetylmuramoyl-L-alanine--D-glutamate ligase [Clostridiales bacterium]|nr:UDP-N-acetylmuramoyl-L-alanine--D-glutamate ligase [Clostridiales bacterium]